LVHWIVGKSVRDLLQAQGITWKAFPVIWVVCT